MCKAMQAKAKYMKDMRLSNRRGERHNKYTSAKKHSNNIKDLKALVSYTVAREPKIKKKSKDKDNDDSNLDDESEHFNFEKLEIGADSDQE